MEGEPAGVARLQQVRGGQPIQQLRCPPDRHGGQRGGGRCGHLRAWHQSQQPEQPPVVQVQDGVGGVEGGPHRGFGVAVHRQPGEPARLGQRGQVVGDAAAGLVEQVGGGDPQCQRQQPAHPSQLGGRRRLGRHPVRADDAGQQLAGLGGGEHIQREGPGAVAGDQPQEPVAAGDQHQAAGAGGQQGADLVGVAGVVQHHQQPLVGQQRPVHGGGLRLVGGDLRGGHAQGVQELGQRLDRAQGRGGGVAAQVDVQLPVREPGPSPMGPAHRQGGLADAGGAGDGGDDHRGRLLVTLVQQHVQGAQLLIAAGEPGDVRGELRRCGPCGRLTDGAGRRLRPRRRAEAVPFGSRQPEGIGQQAHRARSWPADPAGLDLAETAHADPAPVGQFLLRDAQPPSMGAHHVAEHPSPHGGTPSRCIADAATPGWVDGGTAGPRPRCRSSTGVVPGPRRLLLRDCTDEPAIGREEQSMRRRALMAASVAALVIAFASPA